MVNVVIIGAGGRMGRALIRAACEIPDVAVVGAVASTTSSSLGEDAGELAALGRRLDVSVTDDLAATLPRADVVIDFSQPHATHSNLNVCRAARKPLLIGTTGFASELASAFDAAGTDIPLLVAPNTSIGVTLLIELSRLAAKALPLDFDIEIIEAHHRMKRDAPSGTALALGKAAAQGRGLPEEAVAKAAGLAAAAVGSTAWASSGGSASAGSQAPTACAVSALGESASTSGASSAASGASTVGSASNAASAAGGAVAPGAINRAGERATGDIGFAVIRGGDIVGDHTVLFAGTGEQVTLGHRANDRVVFARGALRAALWLATRPRGRYFMRDFLGLKTEA